VQGLLLAPWLAGRRLAWLAVAWPGLAMALGWLAAAWTLQASMYSM
jgi:hypothetical protein